MSNNKTETYLFCEQFKALSNPHRLALFHRLSTCCPVGTRCDTEAVIRFTVGQLGEGLDIAPSTLSHHLKELSRAGLIQTERQGKQVLCWVEGETLQRLAAFFGESSELTSSK
ncbi:MAG: metalloregulator ArsR/SmtB family transcription factor [bacterium]|nr:metalloregulator ArsR/SmtB family transcription factor [bacterium]